MLQTNHRYIVNVGSVGDPRDDTALATYCIYDDESRVVTFRHIPFSLDEYMQDMAERNLTEKPYFIMSNQDALAKAQPTEERRRQQAEATRQMLEKKKRLTQQKAKPVPPVPVESIIAQEATPVAQPHETQEIVMCPREHGDAEQTIEAVEVPESAKAISVAEMAMPDDPEERKKWIARRVEEKKLQRRQEQEAKKAEIREAIKRKREAVLRARKKD